MKLWTLMGVLIGVHIGDRPISFGLYSLSVNKYLVLLFKGLLSLLSLSFFSIPQKISRGQDALLTPLRSPFLDAPASPTPASQRAAPACRHMGGRTTPPARCWTSAGQNLVTAHLCLSATPSAPAAMPALTVWCRRGRESDWRFTAPRTGGGESGHWSQSPTGCLCASMQERWSVLRRLDADSSPKGLRTITTSLPYGSTGAGAPSPRRLWTPPWSET